ncbi:MAG: hypothetical protein A2849_03110 [Candidatus Taylorbacteria bacterium RIFCSPHIGHO2_01_FULL_51_15]|uniref:Uncharacterized protein n=1 Tax=Candidatus Taylorbacteria bacterium RIFCSPHIGHO2_01_FULL_51_15 TaxID=1802304 RepID=A0A1G2MC30_9BACT|nr:MAG: hypothetical protein A2849_03110 [Candidatus Taylorbacteria bacterium RIFCSPHIGHO2_01_FULL_51_15]
MNLFLALKAAGILYVLWPIQIAATAVTVFIVAREIVDYFRWREKIVAPRRESTVEISLST